MNGPIIANDTLLILTLIVIVTSHYAIIVGAIIWHEKLKDAEDEIGDRSVRYELKYRYKIFMYGENLFSA